MNMISAKKLIEFARKWQKMALAKRKIRTITFRSKPRPDDCSTSSSSTTTEKGHFVVYSMDQQRFVLPLKYLNKELVRKLFELAEQEFGIQSINEPLTLPCDASFMEYVVGLLKMNVTIDVEHALLMSITTNGGGHCSFVNHPNQQQIHDKLLICSF